MAKETRISGFFSNEASVSTGLSESTSVWIFSSTPEGSAALRTGMTDLLRTSWKRFCRISSKELPSHSSESMCIVSPDNGGIKGPASTLG
jgi:hypothetical protein